MNKIFILKIKISIKKKRKKIINPILKFRYKIK